MRAETQQPILLFDGACNLCNALTQFVIRHDPAPGRFKFAALQSEAGRQLLREHGLPGDDLNTFVMIEGGQAYVRSTAALRVLKRLGVPWSLLYAFMLIPRPLRDPIYRWIACNRYRWFGKREQCMMPSDDVRARFLE